MHHLKDSTSRHVASLLENDRESSHHASSGEAEAALVLGRSAALDVCVASSNAAAA